MTNPLLVGASLAETMRPCGPILAAGQASRERTFEAVRPRVAVDDVGVHPLAVGVTDAEPVRDARGHVVVDDVRGGHQLECELDAAR